MFSEKYTLFTSECSRNCDLGIQSTVSLMCKQDYHKGKESNTCQRKLLIDDQICLKKKCEAKYGTDWTRFTKCTGSCMKRMSKLEDIDEKKRSRICDKSDKTLCEDEEGEDENLFCENPTVCPLQENYARGGTYTILFRIGQRERRD